VPAAILPWAPALYALKTVTTIAAKRAGAAEFAPVDNGSPIVEFSYFQTAAGPGTAGGPGAPATTPQQPPPFPQLANNAAASPSATELQPPSRFPTAGGLMDLTTYTQWSWPLDGATAAYFGYDVNVEFCETYVHLLYRAFAYGTRHLPWLHFRCTDRNGNHTLLAPSIIGSVPSIPQQSAVAAGAVVPQLPACVVGIEQPIRGLTELTTLLQSRAGRLPPTRAPLASSSSRSVASLPATLRSLGLDTQASALAVQRLGPGVAAGLLHQIQEYQDALAAPQLWFRPLQPRTRYTLDVVPGPLEPNQDLSAPFPAGMATYAAIMAATDPISLLNALNAYFDWEASLVTLKRVQFTTSRYPTFSAHMANAVAQPGALPGTAPVRNYSSAQDPFDWLSASPNLVNRYDGVLNQYLTYRGKLADVIVDFDPLADSLQATGSAAVNGPAALVDLRKAVAKDWEALNDASGALFDGLIAALGLPDLATGKKPVAVPDTEISLITDNSKQWVTAILLQSPEPLPWQRIWRWIWTSNPGGLPLPMLVVWRADGSSGLLIPVEEIRGSRTVTITFQGNVGAEAPCITQGGLGVVETVALGPIEMGPPLLRVPVGGAGVGRPVFNPPPALKELLGL
jgi:hypothetical protein